jgi:hypothetical protein
MTLVLASGLTISWISALSFLVWVSLMSLGAVMCFYVGDCRSKWLLLPGFAAEIVTTGALVAVYRGG